MKYLKLIHKITAKILSFGYNSHGKWDTLKNIKELELDRGNEWFDDTNFDLNNTKAIWVTEKPLDALYYAFPPEFKDIEDESEVPKYLNDEWQEFQEALKDPTQHVTKINLTEAFSVLEDDDGGYLYVKAVKK
jgi:hypothetical protein